MTISVLEQVKEKNTFYRECRESFNIQHFNLKFKGLNRKRWLLLIAIMFKNIYSFLVVKSYLSPLDCCDTVLSDDAVIKTVKCITVLEFETYMCKYNSGRFLDSLSHLTQILLFLLFNKWSFVCFCFALYFCTIYARTYQVLGRMMSVSRSELLQGEVMLCPWPVAVARWRGVIGAPGPSSVERRYRYKYSDDQTFHFLRTSTHHHHSQFHTARSRRSSGNNMVVCSSKSSAVHD